MRRGPFRLARRSMVLVAIAGLMGCAAVDRYAGRAVVYNIEAEQAQEQALLLNIVRAYKRRPMQFTTVSSITGSATASGGITYATPLNVPFRPTTNGSSIAGFPPVPSLGVNGAMSGGPTFTVPVLDTQEFYDGILKPISGQIWDLYLQNTYPRDLMFHLLVQKIVIRRLDGCGPSNHERDCELTIHNYVGEDVEIDLFQIFSDYLMALGLSTQQDKKKDELLPHAQNVNISVKGGAGVLGGGASGSSGGAGGGGGGGEAQKYSLCFSPRTNNDRRCVIPASLCNADEKGASKQFVSRIEGSDRGCGVLKDDRGYNASVIEVARKGGGVHAGVIMSPKLVARMRQAIDEIIRDPRNQYDDPQSPHDPHALPDLHALSEDLGHFSGKPVLVSVSTRSIEGIIYYLGEVTRRQLSPEYGAYRRVIYFNAPPRSAAEYLVGACVGFGEPGHPEEPDPASRCYPIILVHAGIAQHPDAFLSTYYEGAVYSVDGKSGPVMEIAKQALALSSSSKSLPQSNVISIAGGQ